MRSSSGQKSGLVAMLGVGLGILASLPTSASAYRTLADDPEVAAAARWRGAELRWFVSTAEGTAAVPAAVLENVAANAYLAWTDLPCVPLVPVFGGETPDAASLGDGINTIALVPSGWEARGFPAGRAGTTDLLIEHDGAGGVWIVEADVYLNVESFTFVDGTPAAGELDLRRVLLHEQLHQLGLEHPCEIDGARGAPDCATDPVFTESALFPDYLAGPGFALSADDQAGLCALYAMPPVCEPACGVGEVCLASICVPCGADAGCGPPLACDAGSCAAGCTSDAMCSDRACAIAGPDARSCVARGSFGTACADGDACRSNLCFRSGGAGFCTETCFDDISCGTGLVCEPVNGTNVCRTPRPASCAALPSAADAPSAVSPLVFLTICVVSRLRATRKRR